ncbi:galactosyltransferase [Aureococcus anophagefferens]|nr:galactosyltransferase [Aureococcus anophagefferens]
MATTGLEGTRLPSSREVRRWFAGQAYVRRSKHGARVRSAKSLDSAVLCTLDPDTAVIVTHTEDVADGAGEKTLRSRLIHPVDGWVSSKLLVKACLLKGYLGRRAAGLGKALELCFMEGGELITITDPLAKDISEFFRREPGLRQYFELSEHASQGVPHVILVGDATIPEPFEVRPRNVLALRCDDSYEGLPEKIIFAAHAVRRLDRFARFTHALLKIDDHDAAVDADAFGRLHAHILKPAAQWDFVGQRVIRSYAGNRRWHFDKVSRDSSWHERPYVGPYLPWADGAASYVLSARSMDVLIAAFPVVDAPHMLTILRKTDICEDIMVAKILHSAEIEPREQDYGANWTPEP